MKKAILSFIIIALLSVSYAQNGGTNGGGSFNYNKKIDSIISLLQDSSQLTWYQTCYRRIADSSVIIKNIIVDLKNPLQQILTGYLNQDSATTIYLKYGALEFGTLPDEVNELVPCERWDEYLSSLKDDSIYIIEVPNGNKQLDGIIDTFYCQSVSFSWRGSSSGTAYITGSDGITLDYTTTDPLPSWQVNEPNKLSPILVNATSATGLRVITQGCEAPCFKKIQITDCTTGTPIILGDFNNDFNNDFLK